MMRTITTQTYTNVALTVLILLLAVLVARPYMGSTQAHADGFGRNQQQNNRAGDINSQELNAAATDRVADANQKIAEAINKSAQAQRAIADAINGLASASK